MQFNRNMVTKGLNTCNRVNSDKDTQGLNNGVKSGNRLNAI